MVAGFGGYIAAPEQAARPIRPHPNQQRTLPPTADRPASSPVCPGAADGARFLSYSPLHFTRHPDRAAWAALHAAAPQATVYSAAWWLDAVTAGAWGAVVLPDAAGGYAAALPVPLQRRWRGFGPMEMHQPFFTQQLGVLSQVDATPDAAPFLAALPAGLRAYGQLHYANRVVAPPVGFQLRERLTHHLDLKPSYAELAKGFHQNHRRNLKKAVNLSIGLDSAPTAAAEVIALFRRTKGAELPEVKPRHYQLLQRLTDALAAHDALTVWTARAPSPIDAAHQPLLAGGIFARDERQLIYLLGSVSDAGRAQGAMHAVIDAVLRQEAGTARLLDFEGSMVPSVARFYAGFGAQPVPYTAFARP